MKALKIRVDAKKEKNYLSLTKIKFAVD